MSLFIAGLWPQGNTGREFCAPCPSNCFLFLLFFCFLGVKRRGESRGVTDLGAAGGTNEEQDVGSERREEKRDVQMKEARTLEINKQSEVPRELAAVAGAAAVSYVVQPRTGSHATYKSLLLEPYFPRSLSLSS